MNNGQMLQVCNLLSEKIDEIIVKLNLRLRKSHRYYVGCCPVHGGNNFSAFNLYYTGNIKKGNWNCWTHHCERHFYSTIVGFIRGVLSHDRFGWRSKEDTAISFQETIQWIEKFLNQPINLLKANNHEIDKKKFISNVNIITKPNIKETTLKINVESNVEKGSNGLIYGKNENKMGMRGSINSELFFEDLHVPETNRIGEEGKGFGHMMTTLDTSRVFTASQAVGLAQGAIDEAVTYARQRIQFGKPISMLQGIQFILSDMVASNEAVEFIKPALFVS